MILHVRADVYKWSLYETVQAYIDFVGMNVLKLDQ